MKRKETYLQMLKRHAKSTKFYYEVTPCNVTGNYSSMGIYRKNGELVGELGLLMGSEVIALKKLFKKRRLK